MRPPSMRLPTPEVNARAEEIRQPLNNKARLWRDQCANTAPQLALLSTASQLLNWNNGQFDPTSFASMASALESADQQFTIDCNALLSELKQVDPLGHRPEAIQCEEPMNDAYNGSLLTSHQFLQKKLSSSATTAPHASEREAAFSIQPCLQDPSRIPAGALSRANTFMTSSRASSAMTPSPASSA